MSWCVCVGGGGGVADWPHSQTGGVFSIAFNNFLKACKAKLGMEFSVWRAIVRSDWQFPQAHGIKVPHLSELFSERGDLHSADNKAFKAKAGEMLALYALLRHTAETVLADCPGVDDERSAFESACEVLDLIRECKRSVPSALPDKADQLQVAMRTRMERSVAIYGSDASIPKDHATRHVPPQIKGDLIVLDMFVVERLNLLVKHVSEAIDNTRRWNYSVLASVLTNQCNLLSESRHMTPGLVGKCVAWPQDPSVTLARRVSAFGKDFQNGDFVVASNGAVGCVDACAREGACFFLVVRQTVVVEGRWRHCARYRMSANLQCYRLSDVRAADAWYFEANDVVMVLF